MVTVNLNVASKLGLLEPCEITVLQGSPVAVRIQCRNLGDMVFTDADLFGALCKFRLRLEEDGMLLLCNGARKDVYPSGMARDMGGGRKAYLFKQGQQARREDLVDVLEPASLDQVCTVSEQRACYEAWLRSLQ